MIGGLKAKNGRESVVTEHYRRTCNDLHGCCFVCTLMDAIEL